MDRLAAAFEVKTVDFGARLIEGFAAFHANVDRVADVIEPEASAKAVRRLTAPADVGVFIGHDMSRLPVGVPVAIEARPEGLYTVTRVFEGPTGDDLLGAARGLKAAGRSLGMSIGYRVHKAQPDRVNGKAVRRLLDYSLHEYSFAAPQAIANPEALVVGVKAGAGHDGKPYAVRQRGSRWLVVNPETGRVAGEHETEEAARRQQRALYARVPDAGGDKGGAMRYRVKEMDGRYHVMRGEGDKAVSLADFATEDEARARADRLNADDDDDKTVSVNDLPDSAFLYVEAGGQLDHEGKTVPRAHRHFPYRDGSGQLDAAALRAALGALASETKLAGLTDQARCRLRARARSLLDGLDPAHRKTVDAEAAEWRDGAPIALRGLGYELLDLSEKLAEAHAAMRLLGDDTRSGERMRPELRVKVRELAQRLGDLVDRAEYVDREQDGAADVAQRRRRLQLMGLGV